MGVNIHQTSFSAGLLDPELSSRSDIKSYYSGAKRLDNMVPVLQGGVEVRPGTQLFYNATADDLSNQSSEIVNLSYGSAPTTAGNLENNAKIRLIPFEAGRGDSAIIVLGNQQAIIIVDGKKVASFETPYLIDEVASVNFASAADTMFFVHENHAPLRLIRRNSGWEIGDVPFDPAPKQDGGLAFTDTNGYPRAVALFEGRLYFASTKKNPQNLWGSKVSFPFDFSSNTDKALDDESVSAELSGLSITPIRHLYCAKNLFAFTDSGIFINATSPVTPTEFIMQRNGTEGIANIAPSEMDQGIVFIKSAGGNTVKTASDARYDDVTKLFVTNDMATLCQKIFNNPRDMAVRASNETSSAFNMFVVNGDGTVALLTALRGENVRAWSLIKSPNGIIHRVCQTDGTVFFLVSRQFNGKVKLFIEKLTFATKVDCQVKSTVAIATKTFSGFDMFNGTTVDVVADGAYVGKFVPKNGVVIVPYETKELEVGVLFSWAVETMPAFVALNSISTISARFRVSSVTVQLHEIREVRVKR